MLWHQVPLQSAVIECEFRFDGARGFLIGCDSGKGHVGRLVITPKSAKICEDSTEVKNVHPGQTLGETKLDLKPGEWHNVRFEWKGDQTGRPDRWHRNPGPKSQAFHAQATLVVRRRRSRRQDPECGRERMIDPPT